MNRGSDSIELAEQQFAEARTAVLAEYDAARANLHRRMRSPLFVGGVMLGAIALGYFAFSRSNSRRRAEPENPGAWTRVARTVQVLLPLLIAIDSATRTPRRPRADVRGAAR